MLEHKASRVQSRLQESRTGSQTTRAPRLSCRPLAIRVHGLCVEESKKKSCSLSCPSEQHWRKEGSLTITCIKRKSYKCIWVEPNGTSIYLTTCNLIATWSSPLVSPKAVSFSAEPLTSNPFTAPSNETYSGQKSQVNQAQGGVHHQHEWCHYLSRGSRVEPPCHLPSSCSHELSHPNTADFC